MHPYSCWIAAIPSQAQQPKNSEMTKQTYFARHSFPLTIDKISIRPYSPTAFTHRYNVHICRP